MKSFRLIAGTLCLLLLCSCTTISGTNSSSEIQSSSTSPASSTSEQKDNLEKEPSQSASIKESESVQKKNTDTSKGCTTQKKQSTSTSKESAKSSSKTSAPAKASKSNGKFVVVIDAGHQQTADSSKEPIGPGATATKAKVSSGTSGKTSGLAEYELNLEVARKLQKVLRQRGYTVIMCRTSNKVNLSNAARAQIANKANADAFVRIHANGSKNKSTSGVMTLCQTPKNPYNSAIYKDSKALSTAVLDGVVAETGAKRDSICETDTMSGINWAKVPVTILEMGYMTNPKEDALMATDVYQNKIAIGVANGIDAFLQSQPHKKVDYTLLWPTS